MTKSAGEGIGEGEAVLLLLLLIIVLGRCAAEEEDQGSGSSGGEPHLVGSEQETVTCRLYRHVRNGMYDMKFRDVCSRNMR